MPTPFLHGKASFGKGFWIANPTEGTTHDMVGVDPSQKLFGCIAFQYGCTFRGTLISLYLFCLKQIFRNKNQYCFSFAFFPVAGLYKFIGSNLCCSIKPIGLPFLGQFIVAHFRTWSRNCGFCFLIGATVDQYQSYKTYQVKFQQI